VPRETERTRLLRWPKSVDEAGEPAGDSTTSGPTRWSRADTARVEARNSTTERVTAIWGSCSLKLGIRFAHGEGA
jgi:hypothetical protein